MAAKAKRRQKSVVPALRYRDLGAAVVWLCKAFDFQKRNILANENGEVIYAELSFGDSMIMLGSMHDENVGKLLKQPDEIGGAETQTCYLLVDNVKDLYERVKAAGADFVSVIAHDENGALSFGCRDLEGHIWFFGGHAPRAPQEKRRPASRYWIAVSSGLAVLAGAASVWVYLGIVEQSRGRATVEQKVLRAHQELEQERSARRATAQALQQARALVAKEQRALKAANTAIIRAEARVAEERLARTNADQKIRETQRQLELQRGAQQDVTERLARLRHDLLAERALKEKAEWEAHEQLEKEREARRSADIKTKAALSSLEKLQREVQSQFATTSIRSGGEDPKIKNPGERAQSVLQRTVHNGDASVERNTTSTRPVPSKRNVAQEGSPLLNDFRLRRRVP